MPVSPDDGARLAARAAELVADAELVMLRRVAAYLRVGLDAPHWVTAKLTELQTLRRQLTADLARLDQRLAAVVDDVVQEAYTLGQATAVADLDDARLVPTLPAGQFAAVRTIAADTLAAVRGVTPVALRAVTDAYQAVVADASTTVLVGAQTRVQAAQQALDRLLGQGISGFTDAAGREWALESYTEMAVRTGAGRAAVQGHVDTLAASGRDLVYVIPGPRACPICDGWAGKVLSITGGTLAAVGPETVRVAGSLDDARAARWGHPNCFPAWTPVSAPTGIAASDARWYEGELVIVHTAGGRELAVTPNHPVLTPSGWVAAGALHEGDDLVRYHGLVERVPAGDPHHQRGEAPIGEVHETLRQARGVASVLVPGAPEQFHGDGVLDTEVDVVLADRLLRHDGQPARLEQTPEGEFLLGGVRLPSLLAARASLEVGVGAGHPAHRLVGGGGKPGALFGASLGHADLHGLAAASQFGAAHAKRARDRAPGDTRTAGELLHGLAGLVATEQVRRVERRQWSGHVYNLQTGGGWYLASDLIVHNCRCSTGIFLPGVTKPSVDRSSPAAYEAQQEQRRLERGVRAWKRRRALALTPEAERAAAAKVREWQARVRSHTAAHGLKRQSRREQLGAL